MIELCKALIRFIFMAASLMGAVLGLYAIHKMNSIQPDWLRFW